MPSRPPPEEHSAASARLAAGPASAIRRSARGVGRVAVQFGHPAEHPQCDRAHPHPVAAGHQRVRQLVGQQRDQEQDRSDAPGGPVRHGGSCRTAAGRRLTASTSAMIARISRHRPVRTYRNARIRPSRTLCFMSITSSRASQPQAAAGPAGWLRALFPSSRALRPPWPLLGASSAAITSACFTARAARVVAVAKARLVAQLLRVQVSSLRAVADTLAERRPAGGRSPQLRQVTAIQLPPGLLRGRSRVSDHVRRAGSRTCRAAGRSWPASGASAASDQQRDQHAGQRHRRSGREDGDQVPWWNAEAIRSGKNMRPVRVPPPPPGTSRYPMISHSRAAEISGPRQRRRIAGR